MIQKPEIIFTIPFQSEQVIRDCLIGSLENARKILLLSIHNLEPEEIDWIYAPGWNSIGMVLAHMVSREHLVRIKWIEKRVLTHDEKKSFFASSQRQSSGQHFPIKRKGYQRISSGTTGIPASHDQSDRSVA